MDATTLVQRACAGERSAQDELFGRQLPKLRVYVEQRLGLALGRRVDVEDVVQEACLRAHAALTGHRFAGEGAFFGFLTTLARHVIADVARAARTRKRSAGELALDRSEWSRCGPDAFAAMESGPLTKALRAERRTPFVEAFRALSPRHRRVLVLRHFEQLPARDAAARMGTSEGALHALFRRALEQWGHELELRGVGPSS